MTRTAVLYARVSTDEQARSGYSLAQQIEALRGYAAREGYEVLEEVTDPGWSGASLVRPGLDRVRDLVEAGGVSVVLAQDRDRFSREPAYTYLLRREFHEYGCALRALNDRGDESPEGELTDGILDQLGKFERAKTAERTRRGLDRKVSEGRVIRGNQAAFGLCYSGGGETLHVHEPEMRVLRRIFRWVGLEGESMGEVRRRLRAEGVPAPMGGVWPRSSIRYLLTNELYLPRRPEELAGLLPADLLARLDPGREYGLWTWNKVKTTRWRERGADGEYRNRVKNEARPREEWSAVAVDLSESGLVRAHVDAARERMQQNGSRRPPSTKAQRFWQLSGGIARCEVCGNAYTPHTVIQKGKRRTYYRCYTRYNSGLDTCSNGRSMRAPEFEELVWRGVLGIISDPHRLLRQYEEHVERQRRSMRGDPDREARDLAEALRRLELKESYLLDVASDTSMPREKLRTKLAELDERRDGLRKALREVEARQHALRQRRINYAHLDSLLLQMNRMDLGMASPADRRRLYQALRIKASVDEDRTVRLSGVFDPDLYLRDLLEDPPDFLTPEPEAPEGYARVVTSYSSHPCTS